MFGFKAIHLSINCPMVLYAGNVFCILVVCVCSVFCMQVVFLACGLCVLYAVQVFCM